MGVEKNIYIVSYAHIDFSNAEYDLGDAEAYPTLSQAQQAMRQIVQDHCDSYDEGIKPNVQEYDFEATATNHDGSILEVKITEATA